MNVSACRFFLILKFWMSSTLCMCACICKLKEYNVWILYSYKFKLSIAMQRFLRYHKCTCKYKTAQRACYPGYITHTCIYSICLRLSSQVILHVFTSKKKKDQMNTDYRKKRMWKDTELRQTLYYTCSLTVILFLHFSRSLFLPYAWLRQHTRNPSGIFQTPLPSNWKGKYFRCHFSFLFYIFNRLENDFVVLYSKWILKAFILKPKIITHLMHDALNTDFDIRIWKKYCQCWQIKKTDSFQGWRFQKKVF